MAEPSASFAGPAPTRSDLLGEIAATLAGTAPRVIVLFAPRGWGKDDLLTAAGSKAGSIPIADVDFARCVTNPDEFASAFACAFVDAALRSIGSEPAPLASPPGPAARVHAIALSSALKSLPASRRAIAALASEMLIRFGRGDVVVETALAVPAAVASDLGGRIALIARNLDEFARLVPFPTLENAPDRLARAFASTGALRIAGAASPSGRPRILFGTLHRALGSDLLVRAVPPLTEEEVAGRIGEAGAPAARTLLAIAGGRPLTVDILAEWIARGASLEDALHEEMAPAEGRLQLELRFDYHMLIERTRGHAASRAILNVLAREEGLDLSGIAARLRRSPGSTLDYLRWLLEVELIRREERRYLFADPLLRLHVLLEEVPEHPRGAAARRAVVQRFLASLGAEPIPLRPLGRPPRRRSGGSTAP